MGQRQGQDRRQQFDIGDTALKLPLSLCIFSCKNNFERMKIFFLYQKEMTHKSFPAVFPFHLETCPITVRSQPSFHFNISRLFEFVFLFCLGRSGTARSRTEGGGEQRSHQTTKNAHLFQFWCKQTFTYEYQDYHDYLFKGNDIESDLKLFCV